MSFNFANIPISCQSCNSYTTSPDTEQAVGWIPCTKSYIDTNGNQQVYGIIPQPGLNQQDASVNGYTFTNYNDMVSGNLNPNTIKALNSQSSQQCSGSFNGYDNNNNDCQKCFNFGTDNVENYGYLNPCKFEYEPLSKAYLLQKKYTL